MFDRRRGRQFGRWVIAAGLVWSASSVAGTVDYDREVRPILAENCYACHGPDGNVRKADLRLDRKEDAFRDRPGGPAIVPGDVESSELIRRLAEADPELHMPPPKSGKSLTSAQVETLRRWV